MMGADHIFPNPRYADDYGLLAWGGDISSDRLLCAYKQGIFPWYNEEDPILWWSPNPRMVLYPNQIKISKSLSKSMKRFDVSFDTNFTQVVKSCRDVRVENGEQSWIHEQIIESYTDLFDRGFALSAESYQNGKLVGGLYGVVVGKVFFGESMFQMVSDASKVALALLCQKLVDEGFLLIDCQVRTEHLLSLGAQMIPRDEFLDILRSNNA
jgi:leucyl/phenylalanyl-tRNA--protein transferase